MVKKIKDDQKNEFSDKYQKLIELINNKNNTVIKYPEYKNAYDYVERKFPGQNVLNVTVYKVRKSDLEASDYAGVGGLYVPGKRAVIVSDIPSGGSVSTHARKVISARLAIDEVIVHELLHYVSHKFYRTHDVMMEEEFAYGNSVPYLLAKGHSEENIIRYNMLPFLYSTINSQKLIRKILEERNIKTSIYNLYLRKHKAGSAESYMLKAIKSIQDELHERTIDAATKKGQFIVDNYRIVPDGEENDSDNEYDLEI